MKGAELLWKWVSRVAHAILLTLSKLRAKLPTWNRILIYTILIYLTLKLSFFIYNQNDLCNDWYASDPGIQGVLLPCPPSVSQADADSRFIKSPWYHIPLTNIYHFGTFSEYRAPSLPSKSGQQCVYDWSGRLIVGQPNGGTGDLVSPEVNISGHFQHDVLPWFYCCV